MIKSEVDKFIYGDMKDIKDMSEAQGRSVFGDALYKAWKNAQARTAFEKLAQYKVSKIDTEERTLTLEKV